MLKDHTRRYREVVGLMEKLKGEISKNMESLKHNFLT